MRLPLLALGLCLAVAGCNTTQEASAPVVAAPAAADPYRNTPAGVTPQGFALPQGGGCEGEVARWAAIQDNDLKTGHVSKSVYDQIQGDIARARAACASGNAGAASAIVRASRAKHGYPG